VSPATVLTMVPAMATAVQSTLRREPAMASVSALAMASVPALAMVAVSVLAMAAPASAQVSPRRAPLPLAARR